MRAYARIVDAHSYAYDNGRLRPFWHNADVGYAPFGIMRSRLRPFWHKYATIQAFCQKGPNMFFAHSMYNSEYFITNSNTFHVKLNNLTHLSKLASKAKKRPHNF